MDEMLSVLIEIASRLNKNNIPYMITGSMARNLYAEPRFTNDIDIVVELHQKQTSQVLTLFRKDFYISEEQISDAFERIGFFNIIHLDKSIKCDFILRKKDAFADQCFKRRIKEVIENKSVFFISKEDLILQKLLWRKESRSEQQLEDVKGIVATQRNDLDISYLLKWGKKLSIENDLKDLI